VRSRLSPTLFPWLAAAATFLVGATLTLGAATLVDRETEDREDQVASLVSQRIRDNILGVLVPVSEAADAVTAFVAVNDGQLPPDGTQEYLDRLVSDNPDWRNITLAPGNRMDFIAPIAGNEAALGLRYEDLTEQWPGIKAVIDSGAPALLGPVTLIEGGEAFIYREPIIIDGDYWGMVSVVIDAATLDPTVYLMGSATAAAVSDAVSGDVILGEVGEQGSLQHRDSTTLTVPAEEWVLTLSTSHSRTEAVPTALVGIALSLLAGFGVVVLLRARQRARELDLRLASVADEAPSALFELLLTPNAEVETRFVSSAVEHLLGPTPAETAAVGILHFLPEPEREVVDQAMRRREPWRVQFAIHDESSERWLLMQATPSHRDGVDGLWHGSLTDVTAEVRRDAVALQAAKDAAERTREEFVSSIQRSATPTGYGDIDRGFRIYNDAMCEFLEIDQDELISRGGPHAFMRPEDRIRYGEAHERLERGEIENFEMILRFVTGQGRDKWADVSEIKMPEIEGLPPQSLRQAVDVTALIESREGLQRAVDIDSVTGLYSRRWLMNRLREVLSQPGHQVGVLLIDLAEFLVINRTHGQQAGDEMLAELADLVRGELSGAWQVARLDGHVFAAVLSPLPTDDDDVLADSASLLLDRLAGEFTFRGLKFSRTASIGIAVSDSASTAETLLRAADDALTTAKTRGRSRWHLAEAKNQSEGVEVALRQEDELLGALTERQFVVYYQPKVSLADRSVTGFEALVRWQHPSEGLRAPITFTDALESSGLITRLGPQVLDQVLAVLSAQPDLPGAISINVSAIELTDSGWLDRFLGAVARAGVDPQRITVELTETTTLTLTDEAVINLEALRRQGFGLELDDFGVGYASIGVLRRIPFTGVKLDRSFVSSLRADDRTSLDVVAGIASLVRGLNLNPIAEGIETDDQATLLREAGWTCGQGYLFGRPEPEPIWERV